MSVTRGTLILQDNADGTVKAGVYLGEDPDGTGLWAPFGTVEKIEPGDFDSAPETFANAVNAGAQAPVATIGGDAGAAANVGGTAETEGGAPPAAQ